MFGTLQNGVLPQRANTRNCMLQKRNIRNLAISRSAVSVIAVKVPYAPLEDSNEKQVMSMKEANLIANALRRKDSQSRISCEPFFTKPKLDDLWVGATTIVWWYDLADLTPPSILARMVLSCIGILTGAILKPYAELAVADKVSKIKDFRAQKLRDELAALPVLTADEEAMFEPVFEEAKKLQAEVDAYLQQLAVSGLEVTEKVEEQINNKRIFNELILDKMVGNNQKLMRMLTLHRKWEDINRRLINLLSSK